MNIVDPILFQAKLQPEAPALCQPGVAVISYAQLAANMSNIARNAMTHGVKRGDIVALAIGQPLVHAAAILGLTQAGVVTVSVGTRPPPPELKIDTVIGNVKHPFLANAKHIVLNQGWLAGEGGFVPDEHRKEDDLCRIVVTSGTTGTSKAVALTHKLTIAANARFGFMLGNRYSTFSRTYISLGLATALGFRFLTYVLGRGGTLFFRSETLEDTLRALEIFKVEAMMTTPATLSNILTCCDRDHSLDFHLDTIISGGSLLSATMAARIRPRFCTHLVTAYGATETSFTASGYAHKIAHIEGAVGYVLPGVKIEVVDAADRVLPAGSEGIIRVASEVGVDRYFDDPTASAESFRKGFFYPGDQGAITSDGLLIISGRQEDKLNIGGGKVAAEKIEGILGTFPGLAEGAVFGMMNAHGVEEVWAAVVWRGAADLENLRAHCQSRMPSPLVPVRFVAFEVLPTNETGKVDRRRLREIVTAGTSNFLN